MKYSLSLSPIIFLELAAISDDAGLERSVRGVGAGGLDGLNDVHALDDLAKDDVLAIEPAGDDGGDEELGAVGVGTAVGHGEEAGLGVAELVVLICELVAVDGLAASAVAAGEVTALDHEVLDDAVELGALVAEGLPGAAGALLAGAESAEVLGSLGDDVSEELEDDAASRSAADGDVEVHTRVDHFLL